MARKKKAAAPAAPSASLDAAEVAKFARAADAWWDSGGEFKPLHVLNPARITIIKAQICLHFERTAKDKSPLKGLDLLDVGCGGGLVAEPMARLGAGVHGLDASPENIATAAHHARRMGLDIDYRAGEAADLAAAGERFDVVLALEIIEHVADPAAFTREIAAMVKPGGLLILSTLNRTLKSLALAKFAAEYVLRWVPKGTHDVRKFVKPQTLRTYLEGAGLEPRPAIGLRYDPLKDEWRQSYDTAVNYIMCASRSKS